MDPDLGSTAKLEEEAARKTGYKIVDHRLDFFGICPECQEKI
jgi:Fur family peroxide stress response transcriptional regulator